MMQTWCPAPPMGIIGLSKIIYVKCSVSETQRALKISCHCEYCQSFFVPFFIAFQLRMGRREIHSKPLAWENWRWWKEGFYRVGDLASTGICWGWGQSSSFICGTGLCAQYVCGGESKSWLSCHWGYKSPWPCELWNCPVLAVCSTMVPLV
jgi:hypothetical protein